ncbi:cupredoxin domain-containing protein, partial [Listeria monocytogenes]|nr:cupredoxin domain-containing protein [Listeria monocytogenes]
NQDVSILIDTSKSGEFIYSCGMNMFHGKIIIK